MLSLGILLAGCQSPLTGAGSVEASWHDGRVLLPAGPLRPAGYVVSQGLRIADLLVDGAAVAVPAVVYVHASTGIRPADRDMSARMADWGHVVSVPDSYARPGRRPNSNVQNQRCGEFPDVMRWRNQEIQYAAARVAELPWVHPLRRALVGDSEGAFAVVNYEGAGFSRVVVIDWDCGRTGLNRTAMAGLG